MKLTERTLTDLLGAFRSFDPTPGGGSASALAGAVGASLLAMVAGLPKPRTSNGAESTALRDAGARCATLAGQLEALIDRDSEAYETVVEAYRLPKASEAEKAHRTSKVQDALKAATEAPLDVMRCCNQALQFAPVVARFGNPNAASDVNVARHLLRAGLAGAAENVQINLGMVKDAAYVQRIRDEASNLASGSA